MQRWRSRSRAVLATVLAGAAVLLAGCQAIVDTAWMPRNFATETGIRLVSDNTAVSPAAGKLLGSATATDSSSGTATGITPQQGGGSTTPAPITQAAYTATVHKLRLQQQRIRNTEANLAARFVYVPGADKLNQAVTAYLRESIAANTRDYQPQAHEVGAQLQQRGCVAGSTHWSPAKILSDPQTAPPAKGGTAVVCDAVQLDAELLEIRLRTVRMQGDRVITDTSLNLLLNPNTGAYVGGGFTAAGAQEFWSAAVNILRHEAGSLSLAPIAAAPAEQLRLVQQALNDAEITAENIIVRLPAGIAAPELAAVGVPATTEPKTFVVALDTALEWVTPELRTGGSAAATSTPGTARDTALRAVDGGVTLPCDLLPCVALTYDDGPGEHTAKLLDTLKTHQVPATFFMLGPSAQRYPEVTKRAAAEGHEIGSHTLRHPALTKLPLPEAKHEVLEAKRILEQISGAPVTHFRPPYGDLNDEVLQAVGLPAIMWDVDTEDWRKPGREALISHAVQVSQPGSIILFHDIHADSVAVAPEVISGLHARGFSLVTVTELLDGKPHGVVRRR